MPESSFAIPELVSIDDWDEAYANSAFIPDADQYIDSWMPDAAAFRADMLDAGRASLDIPYGTGKREKYDLFLPDGDPAGLFVFVHGGYWMAFDKSAWSHFSAGMLNRGWAVAMPSYDLAPQQRIRRMTRQIGNAINSVAGMVSGPIIVSGHSAGGHLAARMGCVDSPLSQDVKQRLAGIIPISGLPDLRPLLHTSMNETLNLDRQEAYAESPAMSDPLPGICLQCIAGKEERPEFRRQNQLLALIWTGLGAQCAASEIADAHHFSIIEGLKHKESAILDVAQRMLSSNPVTIA